jgi:hypothetical protein
VYTKEREHIETMDDFIRKGEDNNIRQCTRCD